MQLERDSVCRINLFDRIFRFGIKKYWCEEFLKGVKDFIYVNFVFVVEIEEFFNISSKEVQEWILSDEISIRGEEEVFELVVKWMEINGCGNNF